MDGWMDENNDTFLPNPQSVSCRSRAERPERTPSVILRKTRLPRQLPKSKLGAQRINESNPEHSPLAYESGAPHGGVPTSAGY